MEINGFEIEKENQYNLEDKKTSTCPLCSHNRKKKSEKCLSVYWDTGLGFCNHCGEWVQLHTFKKKSDKPTTYKLPKDVSIEHNDTKDEAKFYGFFESRGIKRETVNKYKKDVQFAKTYFPKTYSDFNESSPGMMFIEMASYIGDSLSYYIDDTLKESLMVHAEDIENVIALSQAPVLPNPLSNVIWCVSLRNFEISIPFSFSVPTMIGNSYVFPSRISFALFFIVYLHE